MSPTSVVLDSKTNKQAGKNPPISKTFLSQFTPLTFISSSLQTFIKHSYVLASGSKALSIVASEQAVNKMLIEENVTRLPMCSH